MKIQQLDKEIAELDKRVEKGRRANVARVEPEPSGFNLYPESVPCCGGEESVVAEETAGSIPGAAGIEEARRRVIEQMPEETQQMGNDMMHELEEFKATFSEDQLAQLEERKAEKNLPVMARDRRATRIRRIAVTPVTAEQMQEIRQQQKMNPAMKMLEDTARQ